MKIFKWCGFLILLCVFSVSTGFADIVESGVDEADGMLKIWLCNDQIKYSIFIKNGELLFDRIALQRVWLSKFETAPLSVKTDADFGIKVTWTGWRAPGRFNNAENPIKFAKNDFRFTGHKFFELANGHKMVRLFFEGKKNSFDLWMACELGPGTFYVKRQLGIRDLDSRTHFLEKYWPLRIMISDDVSVVKKGGFGQPVALGIKGCGLFFGLEYPASTNCLTEKNGKTVVQCGQEMGERIGKEWIKSEWVVEGLTPNSYIKHWFMTYLNHIRVAPVRPYTLYNSWYDLRAVDYPSKEPVKENHVMNDKNVFRMIDLLKENMIKKYGIKLDAFVLDDGWDVYESDWELRKEQFPNGMKPIADELKKTGTHLGIWFGPTGGYSARMKRINWMKAHGYEVVGEERSRHRAMLCLAGKHYSKLFKKRVKNFVEKDGVAYFKWDGIQFSCSEPDHGHPVGIHSRRAVLQSLINMCQAVREKNPSVFLNITSGTWLSPWWVKYANQIWMQGDDYGYSNVPSISRRDGAITYRDYVLYDDFKNKGFWFPISNLMTHGVIKGNLQKLGGEREPLDKFTDNALLYVARGVSMWELYISPDLLTDGEWKAIAKSILWARDRFPILSSTEMIGGNPKNRQVYGYTHFKQNRGIIAVRNPFIEPGYLKVKLDPSQGMNPDATSLVVERVYPTNRISPNLIKAGDTIELHLDGYETAIYEIFPLNEADKPLLAGVDFELKSNRGKNYILELHDRKKDVRLLNPGTVRSIKFLGETVDINDLSIPLKTLPTPVANHSVKVSYKRKQTDMMIKFNLSESATDAIVAVLVEPNRVFFGKGDPMVDFFQNGRKSVDAKEKQKGKWAWHMIGVKHGKQSIKVRINAPPKTRKWSGKASVWLICKQKLRGEEILFNLKKTVVQSPMPPRPWPRSTVRKSIKLGAGEVIIK